MKTAANCIVFEFDGTCPDCSENHGEIRVTIYDIIESGLPTCSECGTEFNIMKDCEVRA